MSETNQLENSSKNPEAEPEPYTVTSLNKEIKQLLEQGFKSICLRAEISSLKYHSSGHIYLNLKDGSSQIAATIWKHVAKKLDIQLKDGMEALVWGDVSIYGQQSKYQINVKKIELKGAGALLIAFENLKKKLAAEGLFDPQHKKPIPKFPRQIGMVTSPTGAAVQDTLNVILRRFPCISVYVFPARVQGEGASKEIATAIELANEQFPNLDLLIVGRGGGSPEDLWAFNEEVVAYAIHASKIPVISAVGHEIDVTISDFVADRRALTPTEAGEISVPRLDHIHQHLENRQRRLEVVLINRVKLLRSRLQQVATHRAFTATLSRTKNYRERLHYLQHHLVGVMEKKLQARRNALQKLQERLTKQNPTEKSRRYSEIVKQLGERLQTAIVKKVEWERERYENMTRRLDTLSPLAVIQRKYSIVYSAQGDKVISDISQVQEGDLVWIRVRDGWIRARVEDKGNN